MAKNKFTLRSKRNIDETIADQVLKCWKNTSIPPTLKIT